MSFAPALEDSPFLCWFTGTLKHAGFVLTNYVWTASLIVLFQAVVLQVPIYKIRGQRRIYYAVLSLIAMFITIMPTALKSYSFVKAPHQCFIENPEEALLLFVMVVPLLTTEICGDGTALFTMTV